jgi:hypothetical protein
MSLSLQTGFAWFLSAQHHSLRYSGLGTNGTGPHSLKKVDQFRSLIAAHLAPHQKS